MAINHRVNSRLVARAFTPPDFLPPSAAIVTEQFSLEEVVGFGVPASCHRDIHATLEKEICSSV